MSDERTREFCPHGPWTSPDEHVDIYPGVTIWDARVSGSLTAGRTRLPLWAFSGQAIASDDDWVDDYNSPMSEDEFAMFVTDLLQVRGCFARLLAVLADAERCDRVRGGGFRTAWWETKRHRKRVSAALRECLEVLEV